MTTARIESAGDQKTMTPSTNWQEQVAPDEADRFERYATILRQLQQRRARRGGVRRALHAKGQAAVEATFTVLSSLPAHAQVGLFATPASYRAYVRFSNGAGDVQSDARPDVRGMAVKLLGVGGEKIIPGMENAPTQDFLLIRSSSTPFRTADEFVHFVRAAATPALLLPRAFYNIGVGRTFQILKQIVPGLKAPMTSFATTPYYSALPIRFGAHAVRYALAPLARDDGGAPAASTPDHLADELATRLLRGPVQYDFKVQFFVDEAKTPIEDASRDWSETDSPYLTIGRLTLLQQDLRSERGRRLAAHIESLSFDPWHAQKELRPLGNMMRARNYAYRASTAERKAAGEPDGSERFD